jgi:hypothetical protein
VWCFVDAFLSLFAFSSKAIANTNLSAKSGTNREGVHIYSLVRRHNDMHILQDPSCLFLLVNGSPLLLRRWHQRQLQHRRFLFFL